MQATKKSTLHAPSPWHATPHLRIVAADNRTVAVCLPASDGEANATLIAAAPDLLAALERAIENDAAFICRDATCEEYEKSMDWIDMAKAAIAKAKAGDA